MDNSLNKTLLDSDEVSLKYSDMGKHLGNMDKYLVDNNKGERLESIDEMCGNVEVNQSQNYSEIRDALGRLCPCILQWV
jgi:hypothetical protein